MYALWYNEQLNPYNIWYNLLATLPVDQESIYNIWYHFNMNILEREKGLPPKPEETKAEQKKQQQQLAPECVDTKLIIWQDDQFEQFEVDYLNQVYPEKLNKNTMAKGCSFVFHFLSSSLYYWVQLKDPEEIEQGKLSSKDSKFIQTTLNEEASDISICHNRWGQCFGKKSQFHKKQSQQSKFKIPTGEKVHEYDRGNEHFEVYRYFGDNKQFIPYKQRFEVLFLFYIDGVSFVDEQTEQWEYYVTFQVREHKHIFTAVLSKYIFKLTSVKERHRISQVFVMPAYQKHGHGKQMLDLIYERSLNEKICFEITTEVPSYEYQCLRDFKELQLILNKNLLDIEKIPTIKSKEDIEIALQDYLLTKQTLRKIKEQAKLPGNQIERLINLLIYAKIQSQSQNEMAMAHFEQYTRQRIIFNRSAFKSRKKVPHITFQNQAPDLKQFFLEKAKQDYVRNQQQIQQILTETLDGFRRVIVKLNKNNFLKFG